MNRILNIKTYESDTLLFNENRVGYFEDKILSYATDTDNVRINLEKFSFIKENNETILKLSEDACFLTLKEVNDSLEIPLDYINYNFDNNKNVSIEYKLLSQDKPLKILIEIGDEDNGI